MLYNQIDESIAHARKHGYKTDLKVLQLIKAQFQSYLTSSKNAKLDDIQEAKILIKMKEQWLDEFEMLCSNNRDGHQLMSEIQTLEKFIPELPTDEQVKIYTIDAIAEYNHDNLSMKDMKAIMNMIKERNPLADGGIVARVFKEHLNGK